MSRQLHRRLNTLDEHEHHLLLLPLLVRSAPGLSRHRTRVLELRGDSLLCRTPNYLAADAAAAIGRAVCAFCCGCTANDTAADELVAAQTRRAGAGLGTWSGAR